MVRKLLDEIVFLVEKEDQRLFEDCVIELVRTSVYGQARSAEDVNNQELFRLARLICRFLEGAGDSSIPFQLRVPKDVESVSDFLEVYAGDFLLECEYENTENKTRDFGRWATAIILKQHISEYTSAYMSVASMLHFIYELSQRHADKVVSEVLLLLGKLCVKNEGLEGLDWTTG